jgi:N-methylhydantoinase B
MGRRTLWSKADEMKADPVTFQIISNSLLYASEEMGLALRNSAYSPNIKERMDHSAAVFDAHGRLLAQAEHIPVHLGSLPWGLRNMLRYCSREGIGSGKGTMVAANDPYVTGTHLNDMTVMAPVHHKGDLVAYVVNKAHHSDVGGKVPGSISIDAKALKEEGFVLEPSILWTRRAFVDPVVEKFAAASRTPVERRGDLKAQVAANNRGIRRVEDVISKYGLEAFKLATSSSFRHSEHLSRRRISKLKRGTYTASDFLEGPEGDLVLRTRVVVGQSEVTVDYSGTSKQVDYPLNAVFGVTISGAYFVLRCLLGGDIPANHGAFAPIKVTAPSGSILNPTRPHPVGGGNVETSQRNADVVFRAMAKASPTRVPAASGGSMNNVMVGGTARSGPWAFYETIGVGLGAGATRDGVDGIQANMTNTMNTPIEEMERAFPIQMVAYEFRPDSSGAGRHRGGSGLIRAYRARRGGITFTVLAEREKHRPWGLEGGKPGSGVEVFLTTRDEARPLPSKATVVLQSGDAVEIRTAGGGGFGHPGRRDASMVARDVDNGLLSVEAARLAYHYKKQAGAAR